MQDTTATSHYSPNTDTDREAMLAAIGVESAADLFDDIPEDFRFPALDIPVPLSEFELRQELGDLAAQNATPGDFACFLGAGSYRHHVPAIVRALAFRGEFLTSYTPYQPEVSQGTLQAHYEFQTLICQLTGMEVANAGMYDGATSLAEAAMMAARITKRNRIVLAETVSPGYQSVVRTYTQGHDNLQVDVIAADGSGIPDDAACVVVQQPDFLGYIHDLEAMASRVHELGALLIVSVDLASLGMFNPPGSYDADIVVAEAQTLGVSPSYGGPYVGVLACKGGRDFLRQLPGRIVGQTVDTEGRTGYVLTLQTREQHIRRERATSNICTSVGLIALMSAVYMAAQGKQGLRHTAELCYHKAHYLASLIEDIPGYSLPLQGTFFREFVVQCPLPPSEINRRLLDYKIIGGLDVSDRIENGMLLCCTDVNTRGEIEALASALTEVGADAS